MSRPSGDYWPPCSALIRAGPVGLDASGDRRGSGILLDKLVPVAGLEPALLSEGVFKTPMSTIPTHRLNLQILVPPARFERAAFGLQIHCSTI